MVMHALLPMGVVEHPVEDEGIIFGASFHCDSLRGWLPWEVNIAHIKAVLCSMLPFSLY